MLNSALRKLVSRFKQDVGSERILVAAFGKHPGWDDHIDDIGLDTDAFIAVKRMLYVQGVGGNIDSGAWDKLQGGQRIEGFRHAFLWWMGGSVILGRMWSSRDGKGRTSYPMVVCVQCRQLQAEWAVRTIAPGLEKMEQACVSVTSAAEVRAAVERAVADFRELAQKCGFCPELNLPYADALARLAARPELGPDREGLLRVLYHIDRGVGRYHSDTAKSGPLKPTLVRVPCSVTDASADMLLWSSVLLGRFGIAAPVLAIFPVGSRWMDIIIGEPTEAELYCLRASLEVIPLTSSVPYNMGSEFIERANQLIDESPGAG